MHVEDVGCIGDDVGVEQRGEGRVVLNDLLPPVEDAHALGVLIELAELGDIAREARCQQHIVLAHDLPDMAADGILLHHGLFHFQRFQRLREAINFKRHRLAGLGPDRATGNAGKHLHEIAQGHRPQAHARGVESLDVIAHFDRLAGVTEIFEQPARVVQALLLLGRGGACAGQALDHADAQLSGWGHGGGQEAATWRFSVIEVAVVGTGQRVEQGRRVAHRAGFRELDGHTPQKYTHVRTARRAPAARLHADHAVDRAGNADRSAAVIGVRYRHHARTDGRAGTAR